MFERIDGHRAASVVMGLCALGLAGWHYTADGADLAVLLLVLGGLSLLSVGGLERYTDSQRQSGHAWLAWLEVAGAVSLAVGSLVIVL